MDKLSVKDRQTFKKHNQLYIYICIYSSLSIYIYFNKRHIKNIGFPNVERKDIYHAKTNQDKAGSYVR